MENNKLHISKQCAQYFLKAGILVAVLWVIAHIAPLLPPIALGIIWAALTFAAVYGYAYCGIVGKQFKRSSVHNDGGWLARFDEHRFLLILISSVFAAFFMASLIFQAASWGWEKWLLVVCAIPINYGASYLLRPLIKKEYTSSLAHVRNLQISSIVTAVLLLVGYVILLAIEPVPAFESASEAFLSVPQPFQDSPSILLTEAGKFMAFVQGMVVYALAKAAEVSFVWYALIGLLVAGSAYIGFASLLSMCLIDFAELKRVIYPLEKQHDETEAIATSGKVQASQYASDERTMRKSSSAQTPKKRYVAYVCMVPLVLAVAYPVVDAFSERVVQTEEYSAVDAFVRDQIGVAAYVLDGKYYDQAAVDELIQTADIQARELSTNAQETLVPLINESFDQRIANVDAYLDWYYSLPADYERLTQFFTGTIEDGMKNQLEARINEGVDDAGLSEQVENYLSQAQELREQLKEELAEYELSGVPDWLIVSAGTLAPDFLAKPLEPTDKMLEAGTRMGLSAGIGAAGGFVAKKVSERIVTKPFFGKIVGRLTNGLAARGLAEAAGAAGGTVLSPGVGTAIGVAGGLAIGTLSDYLFLKADESLNRESYKAEIISALEEERAEMLALVGAEDPDASNSAADAADTNADASADAAE
ncbi:hypothetical protein [Adlercreutzia agrestimuris]|uniref:hypothetical protein n=1 Tax=Adlercreutzia agrestimuris TaxID=2941324 RepID=UPI00203CF88B|nr:hypothetical protein [Adlercreutzia agrestimuris]